jgi:hypothetical protein
MKMPNDDNPNMKLLFALGALRRQDVIAFNSLLAKFNLDRWSDAKEADADAIILECHARTSGIPIDDAEVVAVLSDDDTEPTNGNVQASLNALARKVFGKPIEPNDFADAAGGATSTAEALDKMGRFANQARRVKAAAKASE